MKRLRWKLLAAMIALVVVTLGISGLFTRRVARDQVIRLMEAQPPGAPQARDPAQEQVLRALEAHVRSTGGWQGVDAVIDELSAAQRCRIILTRRAATGSPYRTHCAPRRSWWTARTTSW